MSKKIKIPEYDGVTVIKRKRSGGTKFLITVGVLCLITGMILVADVFTSYFATGEFKLSLFSTTSQKSRSKYFAVVLAEYDSYDQAENASASTVVGGAGSYVWQDGEKFLLMANIYSNKADAESVMQNLQDSQYDAFLKEIEFSNSSFSQDIVKEVMEHFDSVYTELYSNSLKLDKKEILYTMASSNINTLKSQTKILLSKVSLNVSDVDIKERLTEGLIKLQDSLESASLKLLYNERNSYVIKYGIVDCVKIKFELYNAVV